MKKYIIVPSDAKIFQLIKKLEPCKLLNEPKLENIVITRNGKNINNSRYYNKNLNDLNIGNHSKFDVYTLFDITN